MQNPGAGPPACDSRQKNGDEHGKSQGEPAGALRARTAMLIARIIRYDCVLLKGHPSLTGKVSMATQKFRLVTRSDFDGLVCAVLLKHLDLIDDILFVHPKDMQDGKIAISDATSPPTCRMCRRPPGVRPPPVGNHPQQRAAREPRDRSEGAVGRAGRVRLLRRHARLPGRLARHDGRRRQGRRRALFARRSAGSARLEPAELPDGRAHRPGPLPRLPHLELPADDGPDRLLPNHSIDQIMQLPDVQERTALYMEHNELCKQQIRAARRCTRTWWCSTCARKDHLRRQPLPDLRAVPGARTSRSTCCGA
jgi:hypothetical protein